MNLNDMIPKDLQDNNNSYDNSYNNNNSNNNNPYDSFNNNYNYNNNQYMSSSSSETKSEKKPKKKGSFTPLILLILALIIGFGGGYYLTVYVLNGDDEEEKKQEVEEREKELTNEEAIAKLNRFITVASYDDASGNGIFYYIAWGLKELSEEQKIKMTYISLVKLDKKQVPITEVPAKYQADASMGYLMELPIELFNTEYENLFRVAPTYDIQTIGTVGCPAFYKIDSELGKMYLGTDCNEPAQSKYVTKIYKYTEDEEHYYVYQYIGEVDNKVSTRPVYKEIKTGRIINVSQFEGNEYKFETLLWTFDKEYKFISTKNLGTNA